MKLLQKFLSVLYVPLMLVGSVATAIYMISNHFGYSSLALLLVVAIGLSFVAEHVIPYQEMWNRSHADGLRDFLHAVVNEAANVSSVAVLPLIIAYSPSLDLWPTYWPLWGQLGFAILIADCGITLVHYASHRNSMLWRFHSIHHSVKRMYGFNGLM